MRKGFVRGQRWIESGWPMLIVLVLTALPFCINWIVGPVEEMRRWELGFEPWVWIPMVLSTSVSFGLAHAILRNDPDVHECRHWEPKESVWHGVGHAITMLGIGLIMIRDGYPPVAASFFGGLILYVAGEGMPLVKDYMKSSF